MKLPQRSGGYTIVEVMIVLVISTAIFSVAVFGYSQQNHRTEFSQAVNDLGLKIQDTLNDAGTGYYPNSGNFSCKRGPSGPVIVPDTAGQGTNQDCIFIGKAFDLLNKTEPYYDVFTIVGLRNQQSDPTTLASSVEDTANRTIGRNTSGAVESVSINGSIDIKKTLVGDGSASTESNGFAVVSGFGGSDLGGSGATTNQVSISSIRTSYVFGSTGSMAVSSSELNKIITVCIEESGGGANARHATIKIGMGARISVESNIDDWPAGCA